MFNSLVKKLLFVALFTGSSLIQAEVPNTDHPTSYVGTTGKALYSSLLTPNSAFSILGEAGPRNYRANATLGWRLQDNQFFKISGEYLTQDIIYSFISGNSRQWVKQGAVGAYYEYDLYQSPYLAQLFLKGGYSHAPSKNLDSIPVSFFDSVGTLHNVTDVRRIAGSDAGFVSPGVSIQPWRSGRIGVELNYDDVKYDRIYSSDPRAQGFGGSASITQQVNANTELGASVGIRQPFNLYQAGIAYTLPNHPSWTILVDGNYVDGKVYLPNTYNVGIGISYAGIVRQCTLEKDPSIYINDLASWTSSPAIYIPQVLAITDESIVLPPVLCDAPTLVGTIPNQNSNNPIIIATAPVFSGTTPLVFSVNFAPVLFGTTVTIDQAGVLTITPGVSVNPYQFTVTVTATNSCGAVSTSFLVTVPGVG